jgi:hypothetical protein
LWRILGGDKSREGMRFSTFSPTFDRPVASGWWGALLRRVDLQQLAEAKLSDAILLANFERWSNAYYLAGYSVELALKACVARQIAAETIPDKSVIQNIYSHEFVKLVGVAGLKGELNRRLNGNTQFAANWALALEWGPDRRYQSSSAMEAQYLLASVSDTKSGVLEWIRQYW